MVSPQNGYSGVCLKLYQFALRIFFIPLIERYFKDFIRDARESLCVCIPSVDCRLYFGYCSEQILRPDEAMPVILCLRNPITFCFRLLLEPKIGLGEGYMFEDWDAQPKIQDFLGLLIRAKRHNATKKMKNTHSWFRKVINLLVQPFVQFIRNVVSFINAAEHRWHANSIYGSAKNIHEHYDLGNDMFVLFLDPSMTYSCATFHTIPEAVTHSDSKLLEDAQMIKYDKIFKEMDLKSDDRVLEIGCGWGACATRAVKLYGCQWTGLTISAEQLKTAQQRTKEFGFQDKINVKLLDYRLEKGIYDKVIAIEMIEAVGHEYLSEFFEALCDRLRPGGKAYLQAITCPEAYYDRYRRSSDFIKKHIFPGGHLPSERAIREALPPELLIAKTIHIGQHYAPTLDLWYYAWMEHEKEVLKLGYSRQFHRKWQFYFALCSTLFRYSHIDTIQMLIEKSM